MIRIFIMGMIALDAYLLEWVFQPLVDRAAGWRTHYQLAEFFVTGACAVELLHAVIVFRALGAVAAWMALLLATIWSMWIFAMRTYDTMERRGYIPPRDLSGVVRRTSYSFCMAMLAVAAVDVPSFRLGWCAWTLATIAIYFAGCSPGRPRRQRVLAPV